MSYLCTKVLSDESFKAVQDYYSSIDTRRRWVHYHQDYNLFDTLRYDIPKKDYELPWMQELHQFSRLDDFTGAYFLKYTEGSFARVHADHNSAMTIVTQVETCDLQGGIPIIRRDYEHRERPFWKEARRHKEEDLKPPYGEEIIYDFLVEMENGLSAIYDDSLKHGVSYVHKGHRAVLITWFQREDQNENKELAVNPFKF